jgi:hypothetical protein
MSTKKRYIKNVTFRLRKKTIFHVVLYGCETWSLTLREKRRLRVFENRALRRIFGPKREEVTGGWRRLHYEDLHDLYISLNIIKVITSRRMRRAGHVTRMGEMRNAYRILVGIPKEMSPLGRSKLRWEDDIRMILRKYCGNVGSGCIWLL